MDPNTLLTTNESAPVVGAEPITLKKWRVRGRGPAYIKLGGKIRYKLADLLAFIEKGRVDPEAQPAKPLRGIRRSNGTKRGSR
jgi:Helix-turn-helix domain